MASPSLSADDAPRLEAERLTRERILAKALEIVDREGFEGLSQRRLAAELGVTAMALYRHVPSKADIVDGVAELVGREMRLQDGERPDDPVELTLALSRRVRQVMLRHPAVARLVAEQPVARLGGVGELQLVVDHLGAAGVPEEEMGAVAMAVFSFTVGFVVWEVGFGDTERLAGRDEVTAYRVTLGAGKDDERLPSGIRAVLHTALDPAARDAAFEYGLESIVRHLVDRRGPAPR